MNRGVEHAADVSASDRTTVHADSDEAPRELVHDHEHPIDKASAGADTHHTPSARLLKGELAGAP
jgi:hypothetical protein